MIPTSYDPHRGLGEIDVWSMRRKPVEGLQCLYTPRSFTIGSAFYQSWSLVVQGDTREYWSSYTCFSVIFTSKSVSIPTNIAYLHFKGQIFSFFNKMETSKQSATSLSLQDSRDINWPPKTPKYDKKPDDNNSMTPDAWNAPAINATRPNVSLMNLSRSATTVPRNVSIKHSKREERLS